MDDWPPPNYRPDFGSGYRLTLADFHRLIRERPLDDRVARLLAAWFGAHSASQELIGPTGAPFDIETMHAAIQADPRRQYALYQAAMDLWR